MRFCQVLRVLGVALPLLAGIPARADYVPDYFEEPQGPWQENEVTLPPFPVDQNLYSFYVSPTATSRFFVDVTTVAPGSDGVLRYVLVVVSPSGARNVTYEGMRCEAKERRIYASGRPDGTWVKSPSERWIRIQEATTNRQHAALFTDLFCPGGVMSFFLEDLQRAIRKGGQPLTESP